MKIHPGLQSLYRPLLTLLLAGFLFVAPQASSAQENTDAEANMPSELQPEAFESLVSKMDGEQRDALASLLSILDESIDGEGAVPTPEEMQRERWLAQWKRWGAGFEEKLLTHARDLPQTVASVFRSVVEVFRDRGVTDSLVLVALLGVALAIGYLAEWLFDRAIQSKREKYRKPHDDADVINTLKANSLRALIEISDVLVFGVAALLATRFILRDDADRALVAAAIINIVLLYRLASAVFKFVLAPKRADLRLVSTDTWTAQYLYRHLSAMALVLGVSFFVNYLFTTQEIPYTEALRFWLSLVFLVWPVIMIWRARKGINEIIVGDDDALTPGLERMAAWWPGIAIGILIANWLFMRFILSTGYTGISPARGAIISLLVIILPFLDTMVRGIASHLVPPLAGEGAIAEKAREATRLSYIRMGRVILISLVFLLAVKLMGLSLVNIAQSGFGARVASGLVGFLMILALGYLAWEITSVVINRKLAREMQASAPDTEGESGGEGGGAGATRMATVLPILRLTLQTTIVVLCVLLALGQIGVNITPLLAGAGVLGLAIGFGAQTLVKDVVSGVFFLLDDAFRMGEYIDVGGTAGTVEKISVRSLQLRGVTGPVHVLPYGSISRLTNHSRDWVIMKLKFTIPFDTDIDKVRKLFKKIGQEMMQEPELAARFLEPFKGQGAADVTDVGIVVRGKFTTRPGDQWEVRKQVYNRVQKAFEENGIEFARREVWVQMGDSVDEKNLSPEEKRAIAGAAAQAAEAEDKKPA